VARIERIDGELLGSDGCPAPFDRSLMTPYALRHSYAAVPVDVLKELMDHVSVGTTMGYYREDPLVPLGRWDDLATVNA